MAIRQSRLLIAAGLAALLIGSFDASAGGNDVPPSYKSDQGSKSADPPETVGENLKLDAATHCFQCLVGACRVANIRDDEPSASSIARCDAQFRRAGEQAEALGGCHTPDNPSVLGDPIKARVEATTLGVTAEWGGCTALAVNYQFAICSLGLGGRAVNLPAVIDVFNNLGANINENTVHYIQAWGGDGGTAKMVTSNDLATEPATVVHSLRIAGGAVGDGAGRGKINGCDSP
jgi:hypothetical protein